MKSTRACAVVAAAVLMIGVAAHAQQQGSSAAVPRPAPEMAKLKAFEGKWACTGQMDASPFGPAHKTATNVTAHPDLGGFWLSGRVAEAKTAESPMPMEGMFHQTWDPGSKQYVMLWVDNTGGWAQENSAGWQGDTIVWSGDAWAGGQKAGMKESFTFKGAGEMLHTMEINMTGQWLPLGQETCRAVAAHASPKKP